MPLFIALCFIGVAIGGLSAFAIFWPLTLVHLRERNPELRRQLGDAAFIRPSALRWLLSGGYRGSSDRQFTGLATPARIALITTLIGLGMAVIMTVWAFS